MAEGGAPKDSQPSANEPKLRVYSAEDIRNIKGSKSEAEGSQQWRPQQRQTHKKETPLWAYAVGVFCFSGWIYNLLALSQKDWETTIFSHPVFAMLIMLVYCSLQLLWRGIPRLWRWLNR